MKLADNASYFIRFRGRVSGPFTLERLRSMAYAGQLSPLHELSPDRATWSSATTVPGLLPEVAVPAGGSQAVIVSPAPDPAPAGPPAERWYYMDGEGNRVGPHSRRQLKDLADDGEITEATAVWSKGMPDWVSLAEAGLSRPKREQVPGPVSAPPPRRRGVALLVGIAATVVGLVGAGVVVLVLFVFPSRKPEPPPPPPDGTIGQPLTGEQVYQHLVRGTVLVVHDKGLGSGFLIDAGKRLIITNYHVVHGKEQVTVIFPMYDGSGDLITASEKYRGRPSEIGVTGDVLATDEHRDLALIRLIRLKSLPERTEAVPMAARPATTGGKVYSVGSSGIDDNLLWRLTPGNVRGRSHKKARISDEKMTFVMQLDCMVLETDSPTNQGDSGGPVVNDRGELVGVVSNANMVQRQVSGFIDLEEVREFLSRHTPGN